jgi:hypothetical protein
MTEDEGRKMLADLLEQDDIENDDPEGEGGSDSILDPHNMPIDDVIRELQRRGVSIDAFD